MEQQQKFFNKSLVIGFIVGLVCGLILGLLSLLPIVIDKVADRVIQKMTVVEELKLDLKERPPPPTSHNAVYVKAAFDLKEHYCLAKNIFHEAGVEGLEGKIAVGQVTLNRVKSGRWGNTVCEVVYAKAQFSWTLSKKKRNEVPSGILWEQSKQVAREVLHGTEHLDLKNSLFYHTDYIKTPKWATADYKIAQIGQHIFYTKAAQK